MKIDKNSSGIAYYINSDNECFSDKIILDNQIEASEILLINTLSKTCKPILLPIYKDKNKNKLKKSGINYKIEVSNINFLKFILDSEISNKKIICFGLTGLTYEGVSFLKKYTLELAKEKKIIIFLIDYDPSYKETIIKTLPPAGV